jgi:hypothetical protein
VAPSVARRLAQGHKLLPHVQVFLLQPVCAGLPLFDKELGLEQLSLVVLVEGLLLADSLLDQPLELSLPRTVLLPGVELVSLFALDEVVGVG